jgi:hypothetical protein
MELIKKIWDTLMDWAEEVNEYRRRNNVRGMY